MIFLIGGLLNTRKKVPKIFIELVVLATPLHLENFINRLTQRNGDQ